MVEQLLDSLDDPALALVQWEEQYGVVQSRLPASLAAELEATVAAFARELDARAGADVDCGGGGGGGSGAGGEPRFCAARLLELMAAAAEVGHSPGFSLNCMLDFWSGRGC